jgi:TrmH family RNA methyltransferase
MITSAQNARIQLVRSLLGRSKERREANALVVEGVRLLEEAHAAGWTFRFALYSQALSERGLVLLAKLKEDGVEVDEAAENLLDSTSSTKTSQGLLAVLEKQTLPLPNNPELVLILDGIRDPGNLGSLLRSAAAAGVQTVILTPGSADPFAPKVMRAGMGAHFRLPIQQMDWDAIQSSLSDFQFVLAEMDALVSCWQLDLHGRLAIIIGGEVEGAGQDALQVNPIRVCIPMQAGTESLNAAAAGAILLFEARRQRES